MFKEEGRICKAKGTGRPLASEEMVEQHRKNICEPRYVHKKNGNPPSTNDTSACPKETPANNNLHVAAGSSFTDRREAKAQVSLCR